MPEHNEKILIALPNWVGDVVMASPVLAALRAHYRSAQITYLMRPYVREIVDGCGWHDDERHWPTARGVSRQLGLLGLARQLARERYALALLFTNSFRSALTAWLARIPRRVGYARDGRSALLTDRLTPLKRDGRFVPAPILPYYCKLAETLGCAVPDRALRLGITAAQEAAGEKLQQHYGLTARRYALINPGAAFGASKCWLPERFAELCDRLWRTRGLLPVVVGAPNEVPLMRAIAGQVTTRVVCCDDPGTTLGSLKVLVRDAAILVCNDTGPRHYGKAFNIPTVTIFGPTHQAWTDTDYADEIKLQVDVECGPCQLKKCPLDLRCMTRMSTDQVYDATEELLARR